VRPAAAEVPAADGAECPSPKPPLLLQVSVVLLGQGQIEYSSRQSARLAWGLQPAMCPAGQEDLSVEEQGCCAAALARLGVPLGCVVCPATC
jgi:hypothetical protein